MQKFFLLLLIGITAQCLLIGQPAKYKSSGEIHTAIKKLNVLASIMFVAAHPDDENTRLISYLSSEQKAHTTYLSITRGDGGQNLIGTEIRDLLGIIRTQELLAARKMDGGNQHFTRANDFGYSKTAEETLEIWDKDKVLSDVVWAIRKFQPDIIINRFDHRTSGRTHGHHTSSAILSYEAFDLTNNPTLFPNQLTHVDTWQAKRLFFNTSWWFYGSRENFEKADKSNLVSVDAGVYYPITGVSNGEIAALSRSMHKSQGFGSTGTRGSSLEYLEILKGDLPENHSDLFAGINTSWSRVKGGERIGKLLATVEKEFNYEQPHLSVPLLLDAYTMIKQLEEGLWKNIKSKEIQDVIESCLGLYLEASTNEYYLSQGDPIRINFETTNRSPVSINLRSIKIPSLGLDTSLNNLLQFNQSFSFNTSSTIPLDFDYTNSYWLNEKHDIGMYNVKDRTLIGNPETKRPINAEFTFEYENLHFEFTKDVFYKTNDRVKGEFHRPLEITPKVSLSLLEDVYIFGNEQPRKVELIVKSFSDEVEGDVSLKLPRGWIIEPEMQNFVLKNKGSSTTLSFQVSPPGYQSEANIEAIAIINDHEFDKEIIEIQYDHIPYQTILSKATAKFVRVDLKKEGNRVAYIMGAGDKVPESLRQIGYEVELVEPNSISSEFLSNFDACIVGIRAYNTKPELRFKQDVLLDYVKNGGTMVIQYNTSRGLNIDNLGPYPLNLSRDRVSQENAEIRILQPDHPVLHFPNKIQATDFENWVQERGLYFPNEWDEKYDAIFSCNDEGESPKDGSLLVANYGKGYYVYTGISWFRQLPAGIPGAFRLFSNIISLGNVPRP